jgi:site-specific DNA-methyltransferase (adenine-specific)
MKNIVLNCDCMEFMEDIPDKYYELAIVDPPYGISIGGSKSFGSIGGSKSFGSIGGSNICKVKNYKLFNDLKIPDLEYFNELFRISINQIIWGGNYFIEYLKNTQCIIIWNKLRGDDNFADGEIAWTSFKKPLEIFDFKWNGMLQDNMKNKETRIHPTQKPIALYRWLLQNYAKKGDKIFDSHVGSGSSRCACYELGFDFEGCELDKDYWEAQEKRFELFKNKIDNKFYIPDEENDLFKNNLTNEK